MRPSVAVIVSTYNARDTLARVIDAYAGQTSHPDELLVADDGSSDGTDRLVLDRAAGSPFPIRHIWQEDDGFRLARIRNLAVKQCRSDYVIFTDGDCIPHPCFVADHAQVAREGFFVQGKRMFVSREASPSFAYRGTAALVADCLRRSVHGAHHLVRIPGLARRKTGMKGIKTANFAIHRADFVAVNGFNEEFVGWGREDSELVVRLYRYGLRRLDVPNSAIVFHLWHPEAQRDALPENERLLQAAIESTDFRCRKGIVSETDCP